MNTEKFTKMIRTKTCRACIEKCIASSHKPLDWGGSSFFKVMEPNSSFSLGLPTHFLNGMQCGVCKDAILQGPSGHLWHVNLCCADMQASFTDGWESFISNQFIEVGDILVFRYVDGVYFSVRVFEPSGCEKQSTFSFQNYTSCCFKDINLKLSTICIKKRCEHRQNSVTASVSLLNDRKPNKNGEVEVKDLKMDQNETALNCSMEFMNSSKIKGTDIVMAPTRKDCISENRASSCEENHSAICACTDVAPVGKRTLSLPHITIAEGINSGQSNSLRNLHEFSVVLSKSALTKQYRITIPKAFVKSWMPREKVGRSFQVTLLNGKEPKSWKVSFKSFQRNSGLYFGWKAFAVSNGLQLGDTCVFKLVNEVEYTFKVHVIKHELHEDRPYRQRMKRNVTSTYKKMKITSEINPNPYLEVAHKESIINPMDVICI